MKPIITIFMDEKGQVVMQGPIDNKLLCLGLLELAKTIVLTPAKAEEPKIIPATVIPFPNMKPS